MKNYKSTWQVGQIVPTRDGEPIKVTAEMKLIVDVILGALNRDPEDSEDFLQHQKES